MAMALSLRFQSLLGAVDGLRDDEDIGDECDADSDADDEEIEKVREGRCVEVYGVV